MSLLRERVPARRLAVAVACLSPLFLAADYPVVDTPQERCCNNTRPTAPFSVAAILRHDEALDEAHDLVYRDGHLYISGQGDNSFVILRVDDPEILRLTGAATR